VTKAEPGPDSAPGVSAGDVLEALLEVCDDAVVLCDEGGTILTWGPTATRLVGHDDSRVVGSALAELLPEHLRPEFSASLRRAVAGERVRRFEAEVTRADGMPMPVSVSVCATRSGRSGTPVLVVVLRDATEQRLDQAVLAEFQRHVEEGEALAHVGRWQWDVSSGTVQWSGEFFRIHGVDPREFGGSVDSYLEAVHPGDRQRLRAELDQAARSGRTMETDYRVAAGEGEIRVVRVRAYPTRDSSREIVGLRGVGQDVTDLQKRASPERRR
jgi:PAS domain S-box-containing protein